MRGTFVYKGTEESHKKMGKVKIKAKIGVMQSQDKKCYGLPAITRLKARGNDECFPGVVRENTTLLTT